MPRYPDPVDGVFNYVWIDGSPLSKYPLRTTWSRQQIGRVGSRELRFSAYMSATLEIGICNEDEHEQLHDLWTGGGLHTVIIGAPDDGAHTIYTGVVIDEVTANRVDWYYENVKMLLSGILRP